MSDKPEMIVLAGGKGTRLHSITNDLLPKPMVDVYGRPFLYWILKHYRDQGFTNITIATGHHAGVIEGYAWPFPLRFQRDRVEGQTDWVYQTPGRWVVNGDTFIPYALPDATGPTIVACNNIDAGAQFTGVGKIRIEDTPEFYDIGTPEGLRAFKNYFIKEAML